MLRKLFLALTLLFSLSMIWGQGLETFVNFPATGTSYSNGTFTGLDGSMWTYVQCRGDYVITDKALMIGRNRTPQSNAYSGTISGGMGTLSFDYMQAFSTAVNMNVLVNDVVVGNVTATGQQGTILQSGPITVNVLGDFVIKFINVNNSDGQVVIDNIAWTGYTGGSTPTISAIGTLSPFSAYTGTPSASQSYTLSGSSLTANISVTPPAGYAVSTDDASFSSSLSLAPDFNGLVYVRLTGAAAGTFDGNITHNSTGATQVDKAVTGTVTDPVPMINVTGTLNAFSTVVGTPSTSQSYTLSGAFLTDNIIVTPPAGYALSTDNNAFSASLSLAPTFNGLVYVRLTGAAAGTYDGNITHTSTGATQVDNAVTGTVTEPVGPSTFVEENFAYTAGTTLVSNGWIAHNGAGTNSPIVHDAGLVYPDYPPVLGFAGKMLGNGEDVHRNFNPEYQPVTSGVVYNSFLINVTNTTEAGNYLYHLSTNADNTSDFKAKFHVSRDASNNLRFGLTKSANTGTTIPWTGFDYALNTTYLVVLRYEFVDGASNDIVTGWINPAIGPTEPTPTLSAVVSESDIGTSGIGAVGIRQSSDLITAIFDGIRVTNDWALLWSGEAPPTPVLSATGEPAYLYSIQGLPSDEPAEYQLSGTDLQGPITVTAPAHFEVSSTGTDGWAASIQVPAEFNGAVYVRLNSSEVGGHTGLITHTSPGAEAVTIEVAGEVLSPAVVWNITANLVPFAAEFEEPSDIQSYTLSATNTTADISIAVTGPFEISSVSASGPWATNGSVGPTFNGLIYVKMLSSEAGTFNGVIKHTTTNASPYELPVTGTVNPPAGVYASDLFFSEYVEGSSNNKAIEIFNGTGVAVDLSDYRFENWYNGLLTPNFVTLTGTLAHNEVYVLAHTLANATITALADTTNTNVNFNGNDALVLRKISTDAIIDIFGRMGEDPGTEWTADGGYSTLNKTLVRKPTVIQGVTVNPDLGFPTLGTEWDVYPIDTTDYLGAHVFTPGMEIAAAPEILPAGGIKTSPVNVTMSTTTPSATIYYTIDGSVPSDASLNYSITGSFSVSTSTVIKAITYAPGFAPSVVTEVEYIYPTPVSTIAALRAMPTGGGTFYLLTTEAVLTFQQATRHQKYIQDATAAIVIDDAAGVITTTYNLYDGITGITGTLGVYNGLLQFTPVVNTEPATSTGNVVVPEVRTLASLTTDDQAKLIKVMNANVDATTVNFGTVAENINVTDPTATLVMRTFPSTDYSLTAIPTVPQNITCLVGQYQTTMQISPRFLADFEASGGTLMPPDPVISQAAGMITVSWATVDGATNYEVYGSDNPYSGFTLLDTVGVTSYSTAALNMKFFYVRAIN